MRLLLCGRTTLRVFVAGNVDKVACTTPRDLIERSIV
jgi:hypothetical protein